MSFESLIILRRKPPLLLLEEVEGTIEDEEMISIQNLVKEEVEMITMNPEAIEINLLLDKGMSKIQRFSMIPLPCIL